MPNIKTMDEFPMFKDTPETLERASLTVARNSTDAEEATMFLKMLGLI